MILLASGSPRRHEFEMSYKWLADNKVTITRQQKRDTVAVTTIIVKNSSGLITMLANKLTPPLHYTYDANGNMTGVWQGTTKPDKTFFELQYLEYDAHGNPTKARIVDRVRRQEPTVRVYRYTYAK